MKVLLFTHKQDIDGMGCAILARKAFSELDYIPCKTFDINCQVSNQIENKDIYKYDLVFVTDLCIKEPLLSKINKDEVLKNKIVVIDHHKSEIDEGNDKYDFVNITIEKSGTKVSGTSLFYDYLKNHSYLKENSGLSELVELTRSYDVWDWVKDNNTKARKLHILFEEIGYKKYIEVIERMLEKYHEIHFNEKENNIIDKFLVNLENDIKDILQNMKVYDIIINNRSYKIGYVKCMYKYRNDISEYVKKDNIYDVDTVGMIMLDTKTVSYRNTKDIDASAIATYFGGKGHKSAASNPQDNEKFKEVLALFD